MAEPDAGGGDNRGEHAADRLREFIEKRYPQGLEPSEAPKEPEEDNDKESSDRRNADNADHDSEHHGPDEGSPTGGQ